MTHRFSIALLAGLMLTACNNRGFESHPAANTGAQATGAVNNPANKAPSASTGGTSLPPTQQPPPPTPGQTLTPPAQHEYTAVNEPGNPLPPPDNQPLPPPGPVGQGAECGEAIAVSPEWFPGLPSAPAKQPLFTDYQPSPSGLRYTDSRADGLMALAAEKANALPAEIQKASQDFAKTIHNVRMTISSNGAVHAEIQVVRKKGYATIDLHGQFQDFRRHTRQLQSTLVEVPARGRRVTSHFKAELSCQDENGGCHSALLRLDSRNDKNHLLKSIFIVRRQGNAHLTMAEEDRRRFAAIPNSNYSAFAEFLSNTVNNSCLDSLADVSNGKRSLPACAINRLRLECGTDDFKSPAMRELRVSAWAVAYGHSAFELQMVGDRGHLAIQGPLVVSPSHPVFDKPLSVRGDFKGIKAIRLMNNDGGGNLNFLVEFNGEPQSQMRFNVSTLLPNTVGATRQGG